MPERTDVYEQLADELRQAIISGQYQPGDRLPSTLDIMARTGVANLTVRGAYQLLVQEGLVESVSRKGFYVRRPSVMNWQMNLARGGRRDSAAALDGWAADAEAAGLAYREEVSVAIEDASVPILGSPAGERLALPAGSRVLVRRTVRYTGPAGGTPSDADSLADEYYPYELVRDTQLAAPGPASPPDIMAGLGLRIRSHVDELRPRVATVEERRMLRLPQVSVVLELARTGYTADRQAVLVLHQVRRGDGATYLYEIAHPGR